MMRVVNLSNCVVKPLIRLLKTLRPNSWLSKERGREQGEERGRQEAGGGRGCAAIYAMAHSQRTLVQDIAAQVVEGHWEVLVNGTLFRSIRGVQSKLELIDTPNALESLSRCGKHGCRAHWPGAVRTSLLCGLAPSCLVRHSALASLCPIAAQCLTPRVSLQVDSK